MEKTLYEKIFNAHIIHKEKNRIPLIYIDLHLLHEVTSPQAFESLENKKRSVFRPKKTFATMDHNVSTISNDIFASGKMAAIQMQELKKNCKKNNISLYDINHSKQGIIHVISPEEGLILPGMTIVCGDSHTSTHGAFGALAFGIGTSEVEHVLATQTLQQKKYKTMHIKINGTLNKYVTSKDLILFIIGKLGTSGGRGFVVEFSGSIIDNFSMESRMTICNMSIEMGAKSGIIAPDKTTFNYLKNKLFSPKNEKWNQAIKYWKKLKSDKKAIFDQQKEFNVSTLKPQVTWGTNPSQVVCIDNNIPYLKDFSCEIEKQEFLKSIEYMKLKPGTKIEEIYINKVFIGSCTNSRIEDLRLVAKIVKNKTVSSKVHAMIVPGSKQVKQQAEKEGLARIFIDSGFEWRLPGCSMCLAMNNDRLKKGDRCASTSNRNFEDRQGRGGRTHLVSPAMAAAAAIYGRFVDIRKINF